MKYFKNTELAKLYHVSEKSVRNWIDAAEKGKLELQLHEEKGKSYIANTSKNTQLVEQLSKKGRKYRNTLSYKEVTPSPRFYQLYSSKQILDIISQLTIHHETPLQYTYVDGGAVDWDKYATRLYESQTPNILTETLSLLADTANSVDRMLGDNKVNVVDLGPGNGLPIRSTLERLFKAGRLDRYIPIDISTDMLAIVEKNVTAWFGGAVKIEPHVRDISYERFNDILARGSGNEERVNLVFLMGGTLANFRSPSQVLQVINNSMDVNDVLINCGYLDTPKTRRYFDYYNASDRKVPVQDGIILDFLNIDQSLYEVEQKFDLDKRARTISVRPKVDLRITINFDEGPRSVELLKDEPILIWRHRHKTALEVIGMFEENDFDLMQATKSANQEYLLVAAKIKVKSIDD